MSSLLEFYPQNHHLQSKFFEKKWIVVPIVTNAMPCWRWQLSRSADYFLSYSKLTEEWLNYKITCHKSNHSKICTTDDHFINTPCEHRKTECRCLFEELHEILHLIDLEDFEDDGFADKIHLKSIDKAHRMLVRCSIILNYRLFIHI